MNRYNLNNPKEQLRRKRISEKMKLLRATTNPSWNKNLTIKDDIRIKKLQVWKGKKNLKHSQRMKGRIPWNKGLKGFMAGSKNVNWKGGITPEYNLIRNSIEMREWRKKIFLKDNFTCQQCRKTNCYLEAHHIEPFSTHPQSRLDLLKGITLCKECHRQLHKKSLCQE